jgi:hypothetical protein
VLNFYRIIEVSNEVTTGETYVAVEFWPDADAFQRGEDPTLTNDFIMRLRHNAVRIVTDGRGFWKRLSDGVFVDPARLQDGDATVWERETFQRDLAAEIKTNIETYADRADAAGWTGDHTADSTKPFLVAGEVIPQRSDSPLLVRDNQDRNGATKRAEVQALVGATVSRA